MRASLLVVKSGADKSLRLSSAYLEFKKGVTGQRNRSLSTSNLNPSGSLLPLTNEEDLKQLRLPLATSPTACVLSCYLSVSATDIFYQPYLNIKHTFVLYPVSVLFLYLSC